MAIADAEGFNAPEGHTHPPLWQGGAGPPESSGRGMQEERRRRTWEAPDAPAVGTRGEGIQLLRHGRGNPDTEQCWNLALRGGTRARQAEESCHRESPPHAAGVSYHAEYSAVGKAHYKGKDVTEVRSPHRTLLPDTVGSDHQKPTSLRGIANKAKADKQHRFRDLYRCLDADLLLDCWHDLNKQAASGVDHVTAEA